MAMFVQLVASYYYTKIAMDVIVTYANFCKLFTSLTDDINMNLQNLTKPAKVNNNDSVVFHRGKKAKDFNEIIQFHVDAQQLSFFKCYI